MIADAMRVLGTGQVGRTASDSGPKEQVGFAAVVAEEQGPRPLDDGVEGKAVLAGKGG